MQTFTGYEYLLIDIANKFGLDKELFQTRIDWATENMSKLESLMSEADEPILYIKAVYALQDVLAGIPTGHVMGMDACASGPQIMGALIGCEKTCLSTGLLDPNKRSDFYVEVTTGMNKYLEPNKHVGIGAELTRADVKSAAMPFFYGSKMKPKEIFGEDTPEYNAFYKGLKDTAPGAMEVMDDLMAAWQPYALVHEWNLPDGFHVSVKVMEMLDKKVEVDELNNASFTHRFYENQGSKAGLSIAANVVHSVDGMIVREMGRRCNYNPVKLTSELSLLEDLLFPLEYEGAYITDRSEFVSLAMLDDFAKNPKAEYSVNKLLMLRDLIIKVLQYPPFELLCVHDDFRSSPNHMNTVRQYYIDIMAEIADSTILGDILSYIHGVQGSVPKRSSNLSNKIRKGNYGLS